MAFSSSRGSEINVTPLIDVLLVLLIIFMVILPVQTRGMDATEPQSASARVIERRLPPILVQVDGDSAQPRFMIDGTEVGSGDLAPRLHSLIASRAERTILVRAAPGLDFSTVAGVLDAGRIGGAESVGLLTPKDAR